MQTKSQKTTCPYCGVGCGVTLNSQAIETGCEISVSGDEVHPANFGRLCVKGSTLAETLGGTGRLTTPKIQGKDVSWSDAIEAIASKIQQVTKVHGPDAFAFYLSGQMLTEDYYVANKLAKGFIGTANVDTNSRLCMASAVVGYKRAFGSDTVPCSYEDLENCDLLIMVGSNAAWTHPVLYQRIAAAKVNRPHMRVVVIDPRKTATSDIADLHLSINPGSDALIFNALLAASNYRDCLDKDFIDQHTEGFDKALELAEETAGDLDEVAKLCQVPREDLEKLIQWWCETEKTVSFYSQGINQSSSGVDKCNAIINCHLATGRIGHEGMGPFSITGQPNAMGGREVGGLANQLAAHMDFATPGAIDRVQTFWQAPNMAKANGLKAVDMFQAVEQGKIKIIWIMSTNPMVSLPDTAQIQRALRACEMVIVSDCQEFTDTTAFADVLLPATGWSEKDGTVTNSERRISRQRGVLPPLGEAKHDWWAICQVAKTMGYQSAFSYQNVHEIFVEHAALSGFENNGTRDFDVSYFKHLTKTSYDALVPTQWPVTMQQPNGTARMFSDGRFFTSNGRAQFIPILPQRPHIHASDEYPFILNTGRVRDQWHTMTRTGKAPTLSNHTQEPYVAIHPEDAKKLGIESHHLVCIHSPIGEIKVKAVLSDDQTIGQVFVPIHWTKQHSQEAIVSSLIPQIVDPLSGQPESKHGVVRLEKVTDVTYGFIISQKPLSFCDLAYWCSVTQKQGYRYEIAISNTVDLDEWVLKTESQNNAAGLLNSNGYKNPMTKTQRQLFFQNERLHSAYYFSKDPVFKGQAWLSSQLCHSQETGQSLSENERLSLASGRQVDGVIKGNIVCSCFGVGDNQIKSAVAQGAQTVKALGVALQCGTNCGSCIPELRRFIPKAEEVIS